LLQGHGAADTISLLFSPGRHTRVVPRATCGWGRLLAVALSTLGTLVGALLQTEIKVTSRQSPHYPPIPLRYWGLASCRCHRDCRASRTTDRDAQRHLVWLRSRLLLWFSWRPA